MSPTFVELLRSRADERPDAQAAVFLDESEREAGRLTYAELDRRARAIAAQLDGLAGERALLTIPPGIDFIAAVHGCLYARVIAVPSPPPDPGREHAAPRIRRVAADSEPRVVLTTSAVEPAIREVLASHPTARADFLLVDAMSDGDAGDTPADARPDDVAILQYTSGTTRLPRGVVITHEHLIANCDGIHKAMGFRTGDRLVLWLPPFHDMGLIGAAFQPLYSDMPLTALGPVTFLLNPMSWLRAISKYRGTVSGAPDFAYELLVKRTSPSERASVDLSSWAVASSGSELVRRETMDAFSEAFAPAGFRREAFYPCYGLAEATLMVTGGTRGTEPVSRAAEGLVGCGKAVAQTRIAIVDADTGRELGDGEPGEIWVAGPGVAPGYWGRGEESAAVFEARLPSDSEGRSYLRTGDLGFMVDGELFVTGRIADLIVANGQAHHATGIERAATDAVPALRTGCAAAFQLEIEGEERVALVAEVRPDADPTRTIDSVRSALADRLKLELGAVALIAPRTLPRTTSGKIRRSACRALLESGELTTVESWRTLTSAAGRL